MKRHAAAALVVITASVAIGCARKPAVDRAALRPISLPDLSLMEPQVQRQIQDQYAALTSKSRSAATPQDELAAEYGAMGKLLLSAESLGAAEACLQNAQTLAPGEPRWPYYLGHLYKARAETEKSVAAFARALELRPADVATLVWLGNAYLEEDRVELAEPVFTKALSVQPQSGAAMSGLGRAALARRDYAEAVRKLEAALALSPQASAIQYPLSLGYRGLGDAGKADAHLRQRGDKEPIPIDPWMDEVRGLLHSVVAYEKRGLRALDDGNYPAAIESLRQGLTYAPDNPALRHELGTALYLSGDAQGALNEFTEITRRSPGFAKAHYSLGMLLASQGRVGDSVERFAAAVKADPDYPAAEFQLAEALRRTGRTAESLSHYTHVIKADPKTAEVRIGYAMALGRLGRYLEARRALTDAMQAIPDQPSLGQALARVLAAAPDDRVRDGRQAVAITQTLMQKPHGVDLYEAVAMSLAELGQYDQAVQWQEGAIAAAIKEGHAELGNAMAANLRLYESHMPCRTPWRNDQ